MDKLLKNKYLVYTESFNSENTIKNFEFTDPTGWKMELEENGSHSLSLVKKAEYEPEVRSPLSIALISGKTFGSFVLEADLQQTGRVYNHQDMCLFFGFQDPSHFYYAHISKAMDDHANQIFIVNGEPRTKISLKTNEGQQWEAGKWHKIKLERDLVTGLIHLYFDDMKNPVMVAKDQTFGKGKIGFGSFDDVGKIDNVKIWSRDYSVVRKKHYK
jgi:hypothetical protein